MVSQSAATGTEAIPAPALRARQASSSPRGGPSRSAGRGRCTATYQVCITHYRRQHYLGRYRLPVNAALVYEESARVLKGEGWKVNFRSRGEYKDARAREIGVGRGAGGEGGSARLLHPVGSEAHRAGYRWLEGAAD